MWYILQTVNRAFDFLLIYFILQSFFWSLEGDITQGKNVAQILDLNQNLCPGFFSFNMM